MDVNSGRTFGFVNPVSNVGNSVLKKWVFWKKNLVSIAFHMNLKLRTVNFGRVMVVLKFLTH